MTDTLGPLPEPFMELHRELSPHVYAAWADQMRSYALAEVAKARADERERCAKVCRPLTDEQMLELVLPITHDAPTTYLALCYESGPYSVTKLRSSAIALIRAVERAHGISLSESR